MSTSFEGYMVKESTSRDLIVPPEDPTNPPIESTKNLIVISSD